jgi:hypothetical protein
MPCAFMPTEPSVTIQVVCQPIGGLWEFPERWKGNFFSILFPIGPKIAQ